MQQCPVVLTRRVNSFLEGTRKGNQRIESLWGHLRRQCVQSYMNLFHSIQDEGSFTGNYVDINILLFCFTHILQVRFFLFSPFCYFRKIPKPTFMSLKLLENDFRNTVNNLFCVCILYFLSSQISSTYIRGREMLRSKCVLLYYPSQNC